MFFEKLGSVVVLIIRWLVVVKTVWYCLFNSVDFVVCVVIIGLNI